MQPGCSGTLAPAAAAGSEDVGELPKRQTPNKSLGRGDLTSYPDITPAAQQHHLYNALSHVNCGRRGDEASRPDDDRTTHRDVPVKPPYMTMEHVDVFTDA